MNAAPTVSMVKDAFTVETQHVRADKFIAAIRGGRWKECVEEIRRETDKENANKLKTCLPGVLFSGKFSERSNDMLVQHSGLLCADLDDLNGELQNAREKLLGSPYLWALFTSPSGSGLKAVFRVPADGTRHRGSFQAVEQHVKELAGVQIDEACKDPARLCFVSYDPAAYHTLDAAELEPLPEPEKPKLVSTNGEANLSERQRIATELLDQIDWQSETEGYCLCPNQAAHTTGNGERDCRVSLDGAPTVHCFHNSCRGIVDAVNRDLRSRIGRAEAPTPSPARCAPQIREAVRGDESVRHVYIDLEKIVSRKPDWIEEPFLARGELHMLQGLGGSYKGTLTLTWAAEFSRHGQHVILLSAEDDMASKVKPLLEAAEANISLIHPMMVKRGDNADALVLPDNIGLLERAISETGATLVIVDPIVSYLSPYLNAHKDQDMKRALTPLGRLAQRTEAAIVAVHHTKKDTTGSPKLWGQGSTAFGTTARVVMSMVKNSEDEVTLEVVKSNIGREGKGMLLRAEIVEVPPDIKVPRLTRVGEATVSVSDLLNGQRKEEGSKTRQAAILMLDVLEEEGEQKQSELFERVAQQTGLKVGTIKRKVYWDILQEEGLVDNRKDGFRGGWLVARSDQERPQNLQSVTPCHNPTVTASSHTSTRSRPSGDLPSVANHDLNTTLSHPSYTKVTSVTCGMVCQENGHTSPLSGLPVTTEPESIGRL